MEDLGDLGFWLAAGIVVAAAITAHGLKEREKERQKQETLRALLTAEGKSTTEILAYMRERDAAEQAERDRDRQWEKTWGRRVFAGVVAFVGGMISFLVSVRALNLAGDQTQSWPVAVVLLVPFAVGALVAFLVYILIRGKKNVPPPGA
jgi:ABC-type transport system involved in cytochrome bd biosynthesis fused ATPase/permease subunit